MRLVLKISRLPVILGLCLLVVVAGPSAHAQNAAKAFGAEASPVPVLPAISALDPPPFPKSAAKFGPPVRFGPPLPPLSALPPAAPSDILGNVVLIEGKAILKRADEKSKPVFATESAPVHLGDTIATGPGTRVLLLLIDETLVTLGENTSFSFDDYAFDPAQPMHNRARYRSMDGQFRYVGGQLTQSDRPDVQIATRFATIGLRDVSLWAGQMEDEYGVFIQTGHAALTTNRGRVTINQGLGTLIGATNAVPTRPAPWSPDRIAEAIKSVRIADGQHASAMIAKFRPLHRMMVARYTAMMANAPGPAKGPRMTAAK